MPRDVRAYLFDMQEAGQCILAFCRHKSFADYQADEMLRAAVERKFAVIGEALNLALRLQPNLAGRITASRKIISFRHIVIHSYNSINPQTVWGVMERDLPVLLREVQALLRDMGDDSTS